MKEIGMDLLPLEVLNKIAENQTLYVLAASSTVSVGLRGSFNQNWMWWPHCNADTPEYLETAECRVDPKHYTSYQRLLLLVWVGEVPPTQTGCGGHTVTRTRLNTWRLQSVEWIRETGMDVLLLEVLNTIAENQTLYVLSASFTVGVGWIGSFNQNWMWWPHCNADMAEYLETAEFGLIRENRTLFVLAASSTVSVGWRRSFNQNYMWCLQCNADTAEYLETAECRVDSRFESPESIDSTQTCLYKKAGNKQVSIKESLLVV
ncbi:hypothetical protein J6590_083173 [Homalodisca vitripennis]|nr:hypothetical protein J6590_083173 [Homalodisca vitripennis]